MFVTTGVFTNVLAFNSRVGIRCLSNFALVEPFLDSDSGALFCSSEALYVYKKRFKEHGLRVFQHGGPLSSFLALKRWEDEHPHITIPGDRPKSKFWKGMDGVLAKMSAGQSQFGRFCRKVFLLPEPSLDTYSTCDDNLWLNILSQKLSGNDSVLLELLKTGDSYLYEFDRAHARKIPPKNSPWGMYVNKKEARITYAGSNVMGRLMMQVRSMFVQSVMTHAAKQQSMHTLMRRKKRSQSYTHTNSTKKVRYV